MGLFSSKGSTDKGANITVTGKGKQGAKATRKEWIAPRKGGGNRRPGQ